MSASQTDRAQFLTVFPAIMLPMFLAIVDQTIVATALPSIGEQLGSVERLSLVMVSYLVALTISAPVFGVLGDSFGRRRLLMVGLSIGAVFSVFCALSTSVEMLVVGRFGQGLGGGGLMTLSHALIGESVPPRQRGHFQSYTASIAVTASTLGPVVGGVLAESFGWQSVFLVNLPLAVAAAWLVSRLPAKQAPAENFRFDYAGVILFAMVISSTLIAMEQLQGIESLSVPHFVGLVSAALVLLPLLIWRERKASHPLLPLTLLGRPSIWRSDTLAFLHGACLVSLITFMPIYLCVVRGTTAAEAGFAMLPMTAGVGVGSILTGWLVSKTGRTAIFPSIGLSLAALCMFCFAWLSPHLCTWSVSIMLGVTSFFMGSVMAVVQITVQWAAGGQHLGRAAASVQLSRSLGAAIGTALIGTVIFMSINLAGSDASGMLGELLRREPQAVATVTPAIRASIAEAFQAGFMLIGALLVTAVGTACTLPLRRL